MTSDAAPTPPEKLSYEDAIEELESIIERIERGEIGLEESLAQYKRGAGLAKRCRSILDQADQQVSELSLDDEDGPSNSG